jgi:GNAT superfamily N-acetyltransferase
MDVRVASPDDLDAVVDLAGIVDPPSTGMDVDRDYYSSIADCGCLVVAEASGVVIGYAGAIPVASARHLSDLFVHPDAHGRGIGRQLLEAVWDADVTDVPRQTFSSVHPSALPLYIRAGMRPMWPLLYLEGAPASLGSSHLTHRLIDANEATTVEQEWLGINRVDQYRYWASRPGGRTFVVLDRDEPVAVGCLSRSRARHTLLHMAVIDRSFMTESVSVAANLAPESVLMAVPGMSAAVPFLVGAGWQVIDHDVYCASETELFDAERLVPHPGLL